MGTPPATVAQLFDPTHLDDAGNATDNLWNAAVLAFMFPTAIG